VHFSLSKTISVVKTVPKWHLLDKSVKCFWNTLKVKSTGWKVGFVNYNNDEPKKSFYSWGPSKISSFTSCGRCGAQLNVDDVDKHVRWHANLDELLNSLEKKPFSR
jgi:hypothetical protein